jgi:hypothetical protein
MKDDGYPPPERPAWCHNCRCNRHSAHRYSNGYDQYGYNQNGYDRNGYNDDGFDSDGYNAGGLDEDNRTRAGDYWCSECESAPCECCGSCDWYPCACEPESAYLYDHSYKPLPDFRGDGPAFYGLEFEISGHESDAEIAGSITGPLCYFKSDCTVAGFEMVTHPMSYIWAMANFPWHVLTTLEKAGCSIEEHTNGIHVHVSRKAFSGQAHLFRWMKFIYRNDAHVRRIARRSSDHWAPFTDEHRRSQINHVTKKGHDRTLDRYNAINTTNRDTLEVRVFASTLDPGQARQALQLVAGSVEYTRSLDAHTVCAGDGWTWDSFTSWLNGQHDTYADLRDAA